ncbi:MAG: ASKHA domain-containing protein, partial [Lachnospiraceae bacterium]|nr:ASKHA domain-containing protein [Lachnospiraceae bacterium]
VYLKGKDLGFRFLQEADIVILPPIGGYVGADALAVHGYVSMEETGRRILSIDIGTNGEILLQCGKKRFACSTAAGPALEGGAVSQGMRAAQGAVDMVSLAGRFPMEDLTSRVIGGGAGRGICGSGLVDSLACLYRTGVIDHTGYMRDGMEAKKNGVPGRIAKRIKEDERGRRFLLTDEKNPVFLTAGDVRQLQLSVSAIRSGAETLLEKAGMKAEQLDRIYLAGAFGCYIGIESGLAVGLFPHVPKEKIYQAGNLAGMGAAMALLSGDALKIMEEECRRIIHVELAGEETFKERFLVHMNFPLKF